MEAPVAVVAGSTSPRDPLVCMGLPRIPQHRLITWQRAAMDWTSLSPTVQALREGEHPRRAGPVPGERHHPVLVGDLVGTQAAHERRRGHG